MLNNKKIGIEITTSPQDSINFYVKMALNVFFYVKTDEESINRIRFGTKETGKHLNNAFFVN